MRANTTGPWLVAVLVIGALSLAAPHADAQNLTSEDYKDGLDRATEIYNSGDIASALVAYLEVRGKFSGPEVDYSIARSYHKLYQCADASIFYMFVMNSYDLPEENALFTKAANYYNELINCDAWGHVELTCTPGGTLFINDDKKGHCLDKPYRLREGTYTFRLDVEGADSVEEKVRVSDAVVARTQLISAPTVVEKIVEVPVSGGGVAQAQPTNWLAWGLVGGGAAFLATSALFNAAGYSALVDVQKAADRGDTAGRKTAEDDVGLNQLLTGVTFGVGLAALGTGVVLLILDSSSESDAAAEDASIEVSFGASEDGGGILLHGRF